MREAADSATRAYRKTSGPHSPKAPSRAGHLPPGARLRSPETALARPAPGPPRDQGATTMRRAGSVLLVQWAAGGSLGDAARYLGIPTGRSQHSFGPELARWLRDHGTRDFITALLSLAAQLDETPGLVNYRNRRQAMPEWCLGPETWQELTSRLPPVPGPVQPVLDYRKRQEACLHLGPRHPGRAPVRTPPDRGQPARTCPQGLGLAPGQHVAQTRLARPDRLLRRTTQTPHRTRQSTGYTHRQSLSFLFNLSTFGFPSWVRWKTSLTCLTG